MLHSNLVLKYGLSFFLTNQLDELCFKSDKPDQKYCDYGWE